MYTKRSSVTKTSKWPKRRKYKSRVGPTAPSPGPTTPSLSYHRKKKKRPGPTCPGPTAPISDEDNSEDSRSSSSNGTSIDDINILRRNTKKDMHNWTNVWKGLKHIRGH